MDVVLTFSKLLPGKGHSSEAPLPTPAGKEQSEDETGFHISACLRWGGGGALNEQVARLLVSSYKASLPSSSMSPEQCFLFPWSIWNALEKHP